MTENEAGQTDPTLSSASTLQLVPQPLGAGQPYLGPAAHPLVNSSPPGQVQWGGLEAQAGQ